ncbi:MAG: hypothetical protein A3D65_01850 [Candidatus Lloydbacteria bacterium RIFCSPHIGHO2_02_FULL_50_13]|uniref:Recombination protein RecR n=1 Tax=Candidatus Lloydbacteria bacterium RIFCSPHIGHO2_02_FULL_50_13 TaxID=1798661 RepID=A0A1G2D0U3_9BACT|nr:MAG: hypothetical protein A3D65_01850 [Candidatus Lloydbacteria bacterium RIFCSPHIGHO2_02_FULL_50_13]
MDPVQKLAALFAEFPGIGSRQSKRFVYFLLKKNKAYVAELVSLIESLERAVAECTRCHRYFMKKHERGNECAVCIDPHREHSQLLVVERDADMEAVEKSDTYHGRYFVLGGTLPILEKEPESKIRTRGLRDLVKKENTTLREIILACAMTPEGEHTAEYVKNAILPIAEESKIAITMLGRGLSTGTELEYSDADTLRYALEGRK